MNNKAKKIIALIVAGVLILSALAPVLAYAVFADELTDKIDENKDKLNDNEKDKENIKNQIGEAENQQDDVLAEKAAIDSQISVLEDEIAALEEAIVQKETQIAEKETQITEKETQITEKEAEIAEKEVQIAEKDELFKKRLRVMYEKGETSYLEVIFQSKSFSDMFTRIQLVQEMAAHDKELIAELTAAKTELETLKTGLEADKLSLEADKQSLEADKQSLEAAKTEADSQKAELEKKSAERDAMMKELESKIEELEKAEAALDKAAKDILAEIKALEAEKKKREEESKNPGKVYYTGGKLGWPSDSSTRVTSPFGMRYHPTLHVNKLHTGMDIGAARGTNVLAAEAGEVIKATWSNAYGNYVVIDHGGGMQTLYAHNSKLLVKKGDVVERGQVIAKVGSTGYTTGPHIHIEVIVNGEYKNPKDYLYS